MPYCTNCGVDISDEQRISSNNLCPRCVIPVVNSGDNTVCIQCGQNISTQQYSGFRGLCPECVRSTLKKKIPVWCCVLLIFLFLIFLLFFVIF